MDNRINAKWLASYAKQCNAVESFTTRLRQLQLEIQEINTQMMISRSESRLKQLSQFLLTATYESKLQREGLEEANKLKVKWGGELLARLVELSTKA